MTVAETPEGPPAPPSCEVGFPDTVGAGSDQTAAIQSNLPGQSFLLEVRPADNVGQYRSLAGRTRADGSAEVLVLMPAGRPSGTPYRLTVTFRRHDYSISAQATQTVTTA